MNSEIQILYSTKKYKGESLPLLLQSTLGLAPVSMTPFHLPTNNCVQSNPHICQCYSLLRNLCTCLNQNLPEGILCVRVLQMVVSSAYYTVLCIFHLMCPSNNSRLIHISCAVFNG